MRDSNDQRNELVMGITLAEVFLLLVFVVWYGTVPSKAGPDPCDAEREKIEALKKENAELAKTAALVPFYQRILDQVRLELGVRPADWKIEDLPGLVKASMLKAKEEGKRGKPTCLAKNVLVEITTVEQHSRVRLLQTPPEDFDQTQWTADYVFEEGQIPAFLTSVQRYYNRRVTACSFDAKYYWKTDADFRLNAERFEPFFYYASRKHIE